MIWSPIESVPATDPDDDPVIVLLANEEFVALGRAFIRRDGTKRAVASGYLGATWTHWCEIPELPKSTPTQES